MWIRKKILIQEIIRKENGKMSENVNITLHSDVLSMLHRLEAQGYEAYAVGGFVRDALLGRTAGDCDVTTNALPEEIKSVFKDERTVDTGIKHGTVTVIYNGEPYEVTTYRIDGEYADNRHPDEVSFTASLREDLARRDFTVNAMAYSDTRGLVDAFGGRGDIDSRLIRAVGNPTARFTEDALRILRAIRFASVLDFSVHPDTSAAIFSEAHRLQSVSAERILVEMRKLFGGIAAHRVLSEYREIVADILGISDMRLPSEEAFSLMNATERMLSVFFLSSASPSEAFSSAMHGLRSDRVTERLGAATLSAMSEIADGEGVYSAVIDYGIEVVRDAARLRTLLLGDTSARETLCRIEEDGRPTSLKELAVDGAMLVLLGYSGTKVGEALRASLLAALRGEIDNDRREILSYIKYLQ